MDMDLEDLVVVADDERITDPGEIAAQGVEIDVRVVLADDIDRVEGEGDGLHEHIAGAFEDRLAVVTLTLLAGDDLAAERGEHGVEHDHKALAAGIDDPGFLQDGILVDGVFQGELPGVDAGEERVFQ